MTETSEPTTSIDPAFRAASLAVQATWSPKGDDVAVTRSSEYANHVVEVVERALLANGWRPPLPATDDDLNKLLGIDDTEKRYTEADYLEAYGTARRKYDEALRKALGRFEWGYRFYDHDAVVPATREIAEQQAEQDQSIEVMFRRVGEWEGAD